MILGSKNAQGQMLTKAGPPVAGASFNGGLAYSAAGELYTTTTVPGSPGFSNGYMVSPAGELVVATAGTPVAASGGIGRLANGVTLISTGAPAGTDSFCGGNRVNVAGALCTGTLLQLFADTWDVPNSNGALVFSNANRRFTYTGASPAGAIGLGRRSEGKFYVEILCANSGNGGQIGLTSNPHNTAVASSGFNCWVSAHADSSGQNGTTFSFGLTTHTTANGTIHAFAIDFATGKVWYAANNVWYNAGNPAAGTGYLWQFNSSIFVANPFAPCTSFMGDFAGGNDLTIKSSAAQLTYAPPSGFLPWSGQ